MNKCYNQQLKNWNITHIMQLIQIYLQTIKTF